MTSRAHKTITIVGGGLAGLTLGIALRQRGIPVTLLEAGHYPRHRVCGEFISGRGQDVILRLGLQAAVHEAEARLAEDAVFCAGNTSGPIRRLQPPGLAVSRFALDAALANALRICGGELREGVRWEGECGEGFVRASGRRVHAVEQDWRWFGVKVHARNLPLEAALEVHSLPHGYVGLCQLNGSRVNICGLFRRRRAGETTGDPAARRLLGRSSGRLSDPPPVTVSVPVSGAKTPGGSHGPPPAGLGNSWNEILGLPSNTLLHARLSEAEVDATSFCSVAGLGMVPQLTVASQECRIGDALTMIPPVTGNGMSMAFEAAELAAQPLAAYSTGSLPWGEARRAVADSCLQAFGSRLAWARLLHWVMFAPVVRSTLSGPVLKSGLLWHLLFARTR